VRGNDNKLLTWGSHTSWTGCKSAFSCLGQGL